MRGIGCAVGAFWLGVLCSAGAAAEPAAATTWRFEGEAGPLDAGSQLPTEGAGPPLRARAALTRVDEVPAAFVYDPRSGRSTPNGAAVRFEGSSALEALGPVSPLLPGQDQSFTIELFWKPARPADGVLAGKTRRSAAAAEVRLQPEHLRQFNQWYCGATLLTPRAANAERLRTGHYLSPSRIHGETLDWRHQALVYDAAARRLTLYTNYYETRSAAVPGPLAWDEGAFVVGGGAADAPRPDLTPGWEGLIDEVRVTAAALRPGEFLRARDDAVTNVDFTSPETLLPRATGYVDVREAFGAVGDGLTDDTAAFRRAFAALANKVPLAYHTLYVPPGTYLLSDEIRWTRFLTVQGAGRDRTILRLLDHAPLYDDPSRPRPVVSMGWTPWGEWGRGAGNVIGNYLFDLSIDTGRGNPAAVALDHHSNNHGAVERVDLRSGDGSGIIGLSFARPWPGPALIRHVRIDGFDHGVRLGSQEYSMTLEHIELVNQRVAGILVESNILALRGLRSRNRVPALVARGGNSMVTLLDSELSGGEGDVPAIRAEGGLYLRSVRTDGYAPAVEKTVITYAGEGHDRQPRREVRTVAGPTIDEFVGDGIVCPRGAARGSLKLPVEDPPEIPWGDVSRDWVNVWDFADRKAGDDWTPAIQAAIDAGRATVYFPQGGYECRGTVHLRGACRRLFGMNETSLVRPKEDTSTAPILVYDDPRAERAVVLERLAVRGLVHASPGTLILRHSTSVPFHNRPGCGKLFLENVMAEGWHFDRPQHIWVRQWNPESHAAGPCITSRGATLWVLGFKTEYESSKLWAEGGARTEILGGFIYPIGKIPPDRPIFRNTDSRMAVIYGTSVYASNHQVHIIDRDGDTVYETGNEAVNYQGSRGRMDLYVSHPEP